MSALTADNDDILDELSVIAQYAEHPVIRRDIARLLDADRASAAEC